jgi:opacity protein-like surface antigen
MKSPTRIVGIVGIVGISLFAACATSRAQFSKDNLFLHADIGPAYVPNTSTKVIGVAGGSFFSTRGQLEFDPGIRGDLSLGYNLTQSWAVELETGAVWNSMKNSGNDFFQVPVMLKTRYQFSLNKSLKAYLGVGAGEVIGIFDGTFRDPNFHFPIPVSDAEAAFGYEAEAGIKYSLSRDLDIDLGYKFMGVNEYDWNFHRDFAYTIDLHANNLFTHSVQLSMTWKF